MSIRRAVPSDAEGIAIVQVAAWQSAYRGLLPDDVLDRLSLDESKRRWQERIAQPWGHVFVAGQADRIVGFAACGYTDDEDVDRESAGEIYVMYVHPEHWRRGHGTALLQEALDRLRSDGFQEAILWVLRGNEPAIAFYERAGFRADGASALKCRTDGSLMPVVRYRQRLTWTEA